MFQLHELHIHLALELDLLLLELRLHLQLLLLGLACGHSCLLSLLSLHLRVLRSHLLLLLHTLFASDDKQALGLVYVLEGPHSHGIL